MMKVIVVLIIMVVMVMMIVILVMVKLMMILIMVMMAKTMILKMAMIMAVMEMLTMIRMMMAMFMIIALVIVIDSDDDFESNATMSDPNGFEGDMSVRCLSRQSAGWSYEESRDPFSTRVTWMWGCPTADFTNAFTNCIVRGLMVLLTVEVTMSLQYNSGCL